MTNDCICSNVPRIWRLAGVTRTVRLTVTKDGSPYDFTGLQTVLRIDRDNSDFHYEPQFTVEGDDNNIIVFTWAADKQPLGDYTIEVAVTDGSGNMDRVNWHGATGVRLVEYSNLVKGEDAAGVESDSELGLDGIFTMNGTGMSAFDEWLASDESQGYPQTMEGYMQWQQHAATEAAAEVLAELGSRDGSAAGDGTMWGDYKSAEAQRNTDYGTAEEHRDGEYATAEAARDTRYGTAEGTSGSAAGNGSRWGAYKTAENTRDGEYSSAEGHRDSEYSSAEGHRDGEYATAEAARDTLYGQAEGTASSAAGSNNRWGSYKTAEAARNTARETAEGTAASSAGDGTRWGAYKTAEAARNTARENAEGTASSTAGDGTRWGAYKTAEAARGTAYGTAEGTSSSTAGDGSRWGAYKTAEAARSEQLNDLEAEVNQLGQDVKQLEYPFVDVETSTTANVPFVKECYLYGNGVNKAHSYGIRVIYNGQSGLYRIYIKDFDSNADVCWYNSGAKPSDTAILTTEELNSSGVSCKLVVAFDALSSTLANPAGIYFTDIVFDKVYSPSINRTDISSDITNLQGDVADLQGDVTSLEGDVADLQSKVDGTIVASYTSAVQTDFVDGYYLPKTATSFSVENLTSNVNMCYKFFEIPETEESGEYVYAYSGNFDNYATENLFFIKANNDVISVNGMLKAGKEYSIPENAKYICVCYLKNYTPFGVQVKLPPSIIADIVEPIAEGVGESIVESMNDYLTITRSHQERTLRDVCYEQERRHPFEWKTFNKRWFAFMNDDANTDMGNYFNVCRVRRVPYCPAFILNRFSSYSFTGNDANRTNLVKNPAIGQEYTVTKAAEQTYLRLYFDRQYSAGFPVKITIGNDSYTINDADNARILVGSGTSVTFTITEINGVTSGRTNFINIIATADATDSVSSTKTWTVQEMIKNIVFDFGEILAHDSVVINMWDLKDAENYYAKYIFDDPRKIDELIGEEHCKGAILPGGPNSNRGMNTELGQHYCCRYLLYADYYGTTPQYMIQRVSYSTIVGAATVNYATAKENALSWLSNKANGFYPLFTHSEKTPEEVGAVIDAILESNDTICSTWRTAYEANS